MNSDIDWPPAPHNKRLTLDFGRSIRWVRGKGGRREWGVCAGCFLVDEGASIYDVHIILELFDPLVTSLSTKYAIFVRKFAVIVDPSTYVQTSCMEAPGWLMGSRFASVRPSVS